MNTSLITGYQITKLTQPGRHVGGLWLALTLITHVQLGPSAQLSETVVIIIVAVILNDGWNNCKLNSFDFLGALHTY